MIFDEKFHNTFLRFVGYQTISYVGHHYQHSTVRSIKFENSVTNTTQIVKYTLLQIQNKNHEIKNTIMHMQYIAQQSNSLVDCHQIRIRQDSTQYIRPDLKKFSLVQPFIKLYCCNRKKGEQQPIVLRIIQYSNRILLLYQKSLLEELIPYLMILY